jgi:hypothetical protein
LDGYVWNAIIGFSSKGNYGLLVVQSGRAKRLGKSAGKEEKLQGASMPERAWRQALKKGKTEIQLT